MTKTPLLFIAAAITVAGCIPAVTTYYEPTASAGTVVTHTCGATAPADTMKLRLESVDFLLRGGERSLSLTLHVPKGSTIVLESTDVLVGSAGREQSYSLEGFSYYDRSSRRTILAGPKEPLVGADDQFAFGKEPRLFWARVTFESSGLEQYLVKLPRFVVNGTPVSVPPVTFRKKSGFGIHPVNC